MHTKLKHTLWSLATPKTFCVGCPFSLFIYTCMMTSEDVFFFLLISSLSFLSCPKVPQVHPEFFETSYRTDGEVSGQLQTLLYGWKVFCSLICLFTSLPCRYKHTTTQQDLSHLGPENWALVQKKWSRIRVRKAFGREEGMSRSQMSV